MVAKRFVILSGIWRAKRGKCGRRTQYSRTGMGTERHSHWKASRENASRRYRRRFLGSQKQSFVVGNKNT